MKNVKRTVLALALIASTGIPLCASSWSEQWTNAAQAADKTKMELIIKEYEIKKSKKFDINRSINLNDETALHTACKKLNFEVINWLVKEKNADVDKSDMRQNTPLHIVCAKHLFVSPVWPSNAGIAPIRRAGNNRNTTVIKPQEAFENQETRIKIINLLIDHGADINAENIDKVTPLNETTTADGDLVITALLIKRGADVKVKNIGNWSALKSIKKETNDKKAKLLQLLLPSFEKLSDTTFKTLITFCISDYAELLGTKKDTEQFELSPEKHNELLSLEGFKSIDKQKKQKLILLIGRLFNNYFSIPQTLQEKHSFPYTLLQENNQQDYFYTLKNTVALKELPLKNINSPKELVYFFHLLKKAKECWRAWEKKNRKSKVTFEDVTLNFEYGNAYSCIPFTSLK